MASSEASTDMLGAGNDNAALTAVKGIDMMNPQERLSLVFPARLLFGTMAAASTGFLVGAGHGGMMAGLRYRAENAHRLPTSEVGWFFYHKSKNYNAMLGGIKEGLKLSMRISLWVGLFFWMEEGVDRARGAAVETWLGLRHQDLERQRRKVLSAQEDAVATAAWERDVGLQKVEDASGSLYVQRDFLSTTVATLGLSGLFSAWNRLPLTTAVRSTKVALMAGVAYGLAEDGVAYMFGHPPAYFGFFKRALGARNEPDESLRSATT